MFNKNAKVGKLDEHNVKTVIAEGIVINSGEISGTGGVRIDGTFNGSIALDGHLIIGETGNVSGEIKANTALFAGTYSGDLSVADTVRFVPGSNVNATVEANKIIMDEGAVFKGHITSAKIFQEEAKI